MGWTSLVYFIALGCIIGIFSISAYLIILLSDLECDYVNPVDYCKAANKYVTPELIVHTLMVTMFLVTGNFISFLLNLPMIFLNAYKVISKKNYADATEIYRNLNPERTERWFRSGFYIVSFLYYLVMALTNLVREQQVFKPTA